MSLVIDDAKIECDAGPINFKPTVMFQTRVFNFNMKNTGLGAVDYIWVVQKLDGTLDSAGPYTVSTLPALCTYMYNVHGSICLMSWQLQDHRSRKFVQLVLALIAQFGAQSAVRYNRGHELGER